MDHKAADAASSACQICGREYCSVKDVPMSKHALNGSWSKHWRLGYERERADRFRLFLALRAVLQTENGSCVYCGIVGGGHDDDCPVPEAQAALHAASSLATDAPKEPSK